MNLVRRSYLLFGTLMLLLLALPAVIQPASASQGRKMLEGSGILFAAGAGKAMLEGNGSITITGKGVGSVWIKGAEIINAKGDGKKYEHQGGTLFVGWQGKIYCSGFGLKIHIKGVFIRFTAVGTGSALLIGEGIYQVNGYPRHWSD